jgi:hypothetical protein
VVAHVDRPRIVREYSDLLSEAARAGFARRQQ